jgi:predicted secreted protein
MGVFEGIVVFVISWWLVLLPILSMGTQSQHEAGDVAHGTERAAPVVFRMRNKLVIATAGAVLITFLIWLAIRMGWLAFLLPQTA